MLSDKDLTNAIEQAKKELRKKRLSYNRDAEDEHSSYVKDCPCWWGNTRLCKLILNGRFTILSGVKCPPLTNDSHFDDLHAHRWNPLQIWARNNRHDPWARLPSKLKTLCLSTNGIDDLLGLDHLDHEVKLASAFREDAHYFDFRTGFDYGIWPRSFNGCIILDPAECCLEIAMIDKLHAGLNDAGLSLLQQLKFFRAALEVQESAAPSFDYPDEILGVGNSPVDMDGVECITEQTNLDKTSTASMTELHITHDGASGCLKVLGPTRLAREERFSTVAARRLTHQQLRNALRALGINNDGIQLYMLALDERENQKPPSFDYQFVLGCKPVPYEETRTPLLPPSEVYADMPVRLQNHLAVMRKLSVSSIRLICSARHSGGQPVSSATNLRQAGADHVYQSSAANQNLEAAVDVMSIASTSTLDAESSTLLEEADEQDEPENDETFAPSERSLRPQRAATSPKRQIGQYPAYITRRGVKHMDDACRYIDNGRQLDRKCMQNEALESPYPPEDLFIAQKGQRCSFCTSKNFSPKSCDPNFTGRGRQNDSRHVRRRQ